MRRAQSSSNLVPNDDLDFEQTLAQLRRAQRPRTGAPPQDQIQVIPPLMADPPPQRTIGDYSTPTTHGNRGAIVVPQLRDGNSEIKPSMLSMVQINTFHGRMGENPYSHIDNFDGVCDTFLNTRANEDQIKLRLFPFSLSDEAKTWLKSLPPNSITTWEQLKQPFIRKYFPPHKTIRLRNAITSFRQKSRESLYSA